MTDKQKSIFVVILIVFFVFIAPVLWYFGAKYYYICQMRKQYELIVKLYNSTSSWSELKSEILDQRVFSIDDFSQAINIITKNAPQYLNKPVYIIFCAWGDSRPFTYIDYLFRIPRIPVKFPRACYFIIDKATNKVIDCIILYGDEM